MTGARHPRRALLATVVVVGLVLAVVARFVTTSPLWLDEALSVNIASLPIGDIPEALRHDGHPPLYYWLLHGWIELFGDGDTAVRSLSGIFGVLALPLMWRAGRRVGDERTGWAALALLAWSPFAVRFATETRMYALIVLLVLVAHALVRRAVDERHAPLPLLAGLAAVTGTLLLTQYWTLYLGATTVGALAWWGRRHGTAARGIAVRLIAALAVGAVAFLPWLPSFLEQAAHTGTPWAPAPRPTVVADITLRDFGGGPVAEAGLVAALLAIFVVLGVFGRPTPSGLVLTSHPAPGVRGEAGIAAATLALGAMAGLASGNTYAGRYASVVLPLVLLVAARGVTVVPGRRGPLIAIGLITLLAAVPVIENVRGQRSQAEEIAGLIADDVGPEDVVVVCPDQLGPALRRELDQAGLQTVPTLAYPVLDDGRQVDWYDYEARNDAADPAAIAADIVDRTPPDARIWVAWNRAYLTFEDDCEALLNGIAEERGYFTLVDETGAGEFFEQASLVVFG